MDSRTVKSISEAAGFTARYEPKLKLWQVCQQPGSGGQLVLSLTTVQVDKMTPDQLRKKLGAKPEKKAKSAKPKAERKPRGAFDPEAKISILTEGGKNPKREGTGAHAIFSLYREGMSVADFIQAGGSYDALRWDVERKFVSVTTAQ